VKGVEKMQGEEIQTSSLNHLPSLRDLALVVHIVYAGEEIGILIYQYDI